MDLLQTKFHSPQTHPTLHCPREILQKAEHDESLSLILLSAPAGFGKTTFLGQYMAQDKRSKAFLSLDSLDKEPRRFWTYFISALSRISQSFGRGALSLFNTPDLPDIEICLISLINDLLDWNEPFTLILDDLHTIDTDDIFRGLDFFIDNMPPLMTLVLSTREDPPLSLGRLRAGGKIREIRQNDLRFSREETRNYLNISSDIPFSETECDALFKRTEGWITGLQLVIAALGQQKHRDSFISTFSGQHEFIFDYLLEEVLAHLDEEKENFLLESSLFNEFSLALCDDYFGRRNGDTVRSLQKANLFLIPLDNEGSWFRYHHLFLDFLRNRLMDRESDAQMKERYARGFSSLKKIDRFDEAFEMGIKGEFWEECAVLLQEKLPFFYKEARLHDLESYIERLPEDIIERNAELFAVSRWNRISLGGDDRVFKGEPTPLLRGVEELIRGYKLVYKEGRLEKGRAAMICSYEMIPPEYREMSDVSRILAGAMLRIEGHLKEAEKDFIFDLKQDRFERRFYSALLQTLNRTELYREMGQIGRASSILEESFRIIDELSNNHGLISTGYLWIQRASISYAQNDLSRAFEYVRRGIHFCRMGRSDETLILGLILKAQIELVLDLLDESGLTLDDAEETVGDSSSILLDLIQARKADLAKKSGKIRDAVSWSVQCKELFDQDRRDGGYPSYRFSQYLVYADILIYEKKDSEATQCLNFLRQNLLDRGQNSRYIQVRIREACLQYRQSHQVEALEILREILELNGEEKNIRIILDGGSECPYLLGEADKKGILPDFLQKYSESDQQRKKVFLEINDFEESFNDRELDIIKYMGEGFSNQEISDTIFLSVNTVRWYARQIYSKLDVKRRGEAVARAKALGLV